jgi:hypothetical protein
MIRRSLFAGLKIYHYSKNLYVVKSFNILKFYLF